MKYISKEAYKNASDIGLCIIFLLKEFVSNCKKNERHSYPVDCALYQRISVVNNHLP